MIRMKKIAIAALALVVSTAAHAKFESGKSATGIRYVKLHVTAKMIIGIRESSGKEFTINLNDLYRAYQECLRFTSPEVKKYIFMGHSPAVALLRMLQKHETY